ncbi:hypothetical protein [Chelatococcus asaccharovorans]|uniref:hypothetical protein n=1 Tax=Chelatococcus asaccharovorans TaxID=28210 RepID=UPI003976D3FD
MQAAECQPSPRKPVVDLRQTEGQDLPRTARPAVETLDALSKLGDDGADDGIRHVEKGCSSGLCKGSLR